MSNLKYRLAIIVGLVLVSLYALFPRDVKVRQRHADGTFYDTVTRHGSTRRAEPGSRRAGRANSTPPDQ